MAEAQLGVLLSLQDTASPQLRTFKSNVDGLAPTLASHSTALRQLGFSASMIGTTFLSMGVAMQQAHNQTVKSIGSMAMLVGGIMTAIGQSVQFIASIGRMIRSLKDLQIAEILAKAFSGPWGWAALIGGAAVAGGIVAGISRTGAAEKKVQITTNVNLDGKQITQVVHKELLLKEQRSYSTGIK